MIEVRKSLWLRNAPRFLAVFCFLAFVASSSGQAVDEVTTLDPANPVERELKGGETHAYRIHLKQGQFFYVVVDQLGIDIAVKLLGPDGQQVAAMDGPNGRHGPEPIAVVAETLGDYRLELGVPNKAAPSGRYRITVVSLREATTTDRERVAAETAFAEAYMRLRPQRTAAARRAAIEKCQESLRFFQSTGDQYRQAWIMYVIGILHAESGEFQKAFDAAEETLPLFNAVGDAFGISFTLNFLGGMSDVLGNLQKALGYYSQALVAARENKIQSIEASVLNNIGKIYNDLADWQKAIDHYNQALALFRAAQSQRLEAIALHNIGVAYTGLGEMAKALDFLQQALPLRREVGDKAGEADTLTSTGYVYNTLGRPKEALELYKLALPLRSTVGDRRAEGTTLDHIGIAYSTIGEPERALEYHQQALERHRAAGSLRSEAVSLSNIGYVYKLLGQPRQALKFYGQAHSVFSRIGDRQNQAKALEGTAYAELSLGNLEQARQHVEEALNLIEAVRATAGDQLLRASYFASRQSAYELYVELLMRLHRENPSQGYDARALQASERARARSFMELLSEAHIDIRKGVHTTLIERERELGQLLNTKAQRQILLVGQKSNEERLADLNREIRTLEDEYEQVRTSIRKASPGYAALTQPQPLTMSEIQEQLDQDTLLLEYSLGTERSYVWAVTQNTLKTYELPGRVQIQKTARVVYELLTTRSLFKVGETATQRSERITQADSRLLGVAFELSQMVIGPVAGELGNKRIVVVADGALQYIPFALLPIPGDTEAGQAYVPLVVKHEIISLPSASTIAVQRRGLTGRKLAPRGVAVIADPVFSATDDRLKASVRSVAQKQESPDSSANTRLLEHLADNSGALAIRRLRFTRQEADQILAVSPGTSNLKAIDFRASRTTVTSKELSKYRYVHFATHGYLDSERPDLSAVVLSLVDERGKAQDGFLRAHEIYNLDLPAELVVLSACETGLGKEIKGEGLVGLTRGFMYAGARRVVVSLWNVNDKATAELMQRFYRRMLKGGQTPAASLRAAQIEMWQQKQWQSPYFWAPFVLQGEWK